MLKAEIRRELDRLALATMQLARVERARDALIRTDAEEPNNPAALLLKLKGLGPEFASLLWFTQMLGRRRLVRSAYQQLANVRLCHPFHLFCRFKFRPPVRRGPPRGGRRPIEAIVTLDCAPNAIGAVFNSPAVGG
jgi:hypothetical protein